MCFATISSTEALEDSCWCNHFRRVLAFIIVSAVVNVLEIIMTIVSSASRSAVALWASTGSTLARKRSVRPSAALDAVGSVQQVGILNRTQISTSSGQIEHTISQCLIDKLGSQITSTDTNRYEVLNRFSCCSHSFPCSDFVAERLNVVQDGPYLGYDILSVYFKCLCVYRLVKRAKCHVPCVPSFCLNSHGLPLRVGLSKPCASLPDLP